jgi:hypothetical protein
MAVRTGFFAGYPDRCEVASAAEFLFSPHARAPAANASTSPVHSNPAVELPVSVPAKVLAVAFLVTSGAWLGRYRM